MMTYEQLVKANESIAQTDIGRGKMYAEVNQRIKAFRMLFPMGRISTDIISLENGVCIMRAVVSDENGNLLGTGTAYEKEGSTFINKTSYIENCETSAIGRALAMCGIGIDTSIASFEEVANAKANQNETKTETKDDALENAKLRTSILKYVSKVGMSKENLDKVCKKYKITSLNEMTTEQCKDYIRQAEEKGINIYE